MIKVRIMFLAVVLVSAWNCSDLYAQPDKSALLAQINQDIWIPFITGVNTNNPSLYNGVHAADFYWVRGGTRTRIMNYQEYVDDARIVMDGRAARNIRTELDIRFLERNVNNEFASEKCIVKYTSTEPGKEPVTSYGITQVFSRHEPVGWRKIVQYVHTEPATEEMYLNAEAMNY